MTKKIKVTQTAQRDLRNIFKFIAKEDKKAAELLLKELIGKIGWIAKTDFTGSPRDHISPGLRALPIRQRCICFRSFTDEIIVIRVLHQAQDVTKQFP